MKSLDDIKKKSQQIIETIKESSEVTLRKERDDAYQAWLVNNPQASEDEKKRALSHFSIEGHPKVAAFTVKIMQKFSERLNPENLLTPTESQKKEQEALSLAEERDKLEARLKTIWKKEQERQ